MSERLDQGRGNVADYALGTTEGWDAFEVVRWHGTEALSRPYEIDITLRRAIDKGPIDLDALLDSGATFRMATAHRFRVLHGIVAEAEEIDRTRTFLYYRVLLVPPMWRMRFRASRPARMRRHRAWALSAATMPIWGCSGEARISGSS